MAALIIRFEVSQAQNGSIIYLNDTTGDYNASSNPGGYGSPNSARTDLALIIRANYKATSGDEALTIAAYDPEVVTQFQITWNELDGYNEYKIYPVNKKTGSETPSTNDFVYDFTANQLQRWNGSAWISATADDLDLYGADDTAVDYPVLTNTWLAFNHMNKLYCLGCSTRTRSDLQQFINEVANQLNGTIALFAEGSFMPAQENMERFASKVEELKNLD